ncbi:MAG: hypothetical protein KME11_05020 [Timaviella obliquedivisa GSE-PSE-MK23-08B]|jgi:hypothetical protein|nr:hypothetical protein [Timaviella obliquedivisa GSE-PSE-MK23-08B]
MPTQVIAPGQLFEVTIHDLEGTAKSALFSSLEAAGEYSDRACYGGCFGAYLGVWNGAMSNDRLCFDRVPFDSDREVQ